MLFPGKLFSMIPGCPDIQAIPEIPGRTRKQNRKTGKQENRLFDVFRIYAPYEPFCLKPP